MKPVNPNSQLDNSGEISALIETLHDAEQRLEGLIAGEVDTVSNRAGRTGMLQHAREQLRHGEAVQQAAILNALPAHIALLDPQGCIASVNETWRKFTNANDLLSPEYGVGLNYLETCDSAHGANATEAREAAVGLRAVLVGASKYFLLEYPCHLPSEQRWFQMTVTPLVEGKSLGAVVMHVDITEKHHAESRLRNLDQKYRTLFKASSDAILVLDETGFSEVNDAALLMFGCKASDELLGKHPSEVSPPRQPGGGSSVELANRHGAQAFREGSFQCEWMFRRMNGIDFQTEVLLTAMEVDGKRVVQGTVRDIAERESALARIKYLNRVLAVQTCINSLMVRVQDRDELFRETCNIAVESGGFTMAMLGIVDRDTMTVVPTATAGKSEELLTAIKRILSSSELAANTMIARAISEKRTIVSNNSTDDPQLCFGRIYAESGVHSIAVLPLLVAGEAIGVLVLYASEIAFFHAEEMALLTRLTDDIVFAMDHIGKQEKLNYLAYYDSLTGLANRSLFLERVSQYMRSAERGGHKLAIGLIDIERFKSINDSLGRTIGDVLLKQVAAWMTQRAGDANLLARIDADHFAVVLPEVTSDGDLAQLTGNLLDSFQGHSFRLNEAAYRIGFKAGVAVFPDDGTDIDTLFKNAEAALKLAKAGGARYLFYTQQMTDAVAEQLALENELRDAIDNEEFVLHYQPKVDLATGNVTGAEALIRWNHPLTGMVPPGKFIATLERTGLIYEVGRWALRQAIADYTRWRGAGLSAIRIAVNVSALQVRNQGFIDEIAQVIGIEPGAAAGLELEITESLIMEDVAHSIGSLQAIRAMGVTVAIDDFGTGYSSLSHLAKLPVDALKIDRCFVTDMMASSEGLALVSTIITLAHSMKLKVVAEGVESEEQKRLLRVLGCDEMQGFLFSKAVPADVFEEKFLMKRPPVSEADPWWSAAGRR